MKRNKETVDRGIHAVSNKHSLGQILMCTFVFLFAMACLLPCLLVVINSFAKEQYILRYGYSFFPKQWSLDAYRYIFYPGSNVLLSYGVTILITVVGTLIALLITYMAGFCLSNPHVGYRNGLALFFFITSIFNSGLVPWYMMCKKLGLYDNIWALIVPGMLFSSYNMFLMRNFIKGVPTALMDSAEIDGAGPYRIAFQVYFPLCSPVIATITLFVALGYWNSWWNAVMLIDNIDLYPLQMLLFRIQSDLSMIKDLSGTNIGVKVPSEAFKMATVVVTIGPIVLLYPFLQRYFTEGLVVGAVKG